MNIFLRPEEAMIESGEILSSNNLIVLFLRKLSNLHRILKFRFSLHTAKMIDPPV